LHEFYNSNQAGTRDQFGARNKFSTPMIANGKVYVGTINSLGVFGLLPVGMTPGDQQPVVGVGHGAERFQLQDYGDQQSNQLYSVEVAHRIESECDHWNDQRVAKEIGHHRRNYRRRNASGTGTATLVITITEYQKVVSAAEAHLRRRSHSLRIWRVASRTNSLAHRIG
jgi:hypothetical protein